jgi:signal transduction histidine kinase
VLVVAGGTVTANQLIIYLSWAIYLSIFVSVAHQALRHPWRANIDIALLFSVPAAIFVISLALQLGLIVDGPWRRDVLTGLLLVISYLLLRLVDDFVATTPRLLRRAGASLIAVVGIVLLALPSRPLWLDAVMLGYFWIVLLYVAVAFLRAARRASGVTRRRLRSVAAGALLLASTFVIAALGFPAPDQQALWMLLANCVGLGAGISFFLGFAPPLWVRRAWQEPELRLFLRRAAHLPRQRDVAGIVAELEQGAARALGASGARIALWDATGQPFAYAPEGRRQLSAFEPSHEAVRAWETQRPIFTARASRGSAAIVAAAGAVLAVPISVDNNRLGAFVVSARRTPLFVSDDLALLGLLADQAAVILESRALLDEATRVRAREEATRLKDEFLSAAAHDLKTPLTTILGRAQLMERRARQQPQTPADAVSLAVIIREGQRLRRLVTDLLDSARIEQGRLVGERSELDLVEVARSVCTRYDGPRHACVVRADGPVVGAFDALRIEQLIENLVENAVKYSPAGGNVWVTVAVAGEQALLTVADEGLGIAPDDLPHVFDRFYRGAHADEARASMGLGLYICRGIVEQHGGQIEVSSQPGQGTTFTITLPRALSVIAQGAQVSQES